MSDQELQQLIREAVREELRAALREERAATVCQPMGCACALPDWASVEMGHYAGMVRDLGHGDMRKGVEEMRENHQLVSEMRSGLGTARRAVFGAVGTAILGAVVLGLLLMAKVHLDRMK